MDTFETQYNETASKFNELYLNQEAHQSTKAFFDCITDEVVSNIQNKQILDLGCGAATDAEFYVKTGLKYFGVDSSKEMYEFASKNKYVTEIKNESFSKAISFGDKKFGLIVSKYAMQNMADIKPIYQEVTRLLDNKGYFIFLVVHPIRQFLEKKKHGKDYFKKENVQSVFMAGKITVVEPSHTLMEYLNKDFLKTFSLIDIREGSDFPNSEQIGGDTYPTYLIITAQKK